MMKWSILAMVALVRESRANTVTLCSPPQVAAARMLITDHHDQQLDQGGAAAQG